MLFVEIATTSAAVAATSGRLAKVGLLAGALRGLGPDELAAGSAYLAGELRQRQTGVGWASLRDLPPPTGTATLTVADVDRQIGAIAQVGGAGSQARRRELLHRLFAAATVDEQRLLTGLFSGELRQGAQAGLLVDAVAKAAAVPVATVRRALLLSGDLKAVATAALAGGEPALAAFTLEVGRPLAPMLAQSAATVEEAMDATGAPAVVDAKLDGIRVQVHRSGGAVSIFTRSLDEITPRLPEVIAAVRALPVREIVLDGEVIALDRNGRPRPFQETSSRAATRGARRRVAAEAATGGSAADGSATGGSAADGSATGGSASGEVTADGSGANPADAADPADAAARAAAGAADAAAPVVAGVTAPSGTALTPYFFDLLHLDGADLLDWPGQERWAALAEAVPAGLLVPRTTVADAPAAAEVFAAAVAAGQEGVVVKDPLAPYDAGRRGSAWVKVKPRHTLDLVVLAVEWGHGRRQGWLSNLHLGARDPATGGFVMLGKTFKGMTDELLRWQTERFLDLAVERTDWLVRVRPEQVVEIAFDGVQHSPRYPGGVALRFARVLRYRHDKSPAEADTIDDVVAIYRRSTGDGG